MCVLSQTFCTREALLSDPARLLFPRRDESVVTLSWCDVRCLFGRLEEVLVMGLRMVDGISHRVTFSIQSSLSVKVIPRIQS